MKTFKSIELFLQLGLLLLAVVTSVTGGDSSVGPMPFILAIGLVQIISMMVNMAAGKQLWRKDGWRKIHLAGVGLVVLLIIIAFIQDAGGRTGDKDDKYSMDGLGTLIYTTIPAVLFSLFYIVITYVEWRRMRTATK